jgi:hypothetical protein
MVGPYRGQSGDSMSTSAAGGQAEPKGAVGNAARRYRRLGRRVAHPLRSIEDEAHTLHEVERAGEAGETPFIVIAGLFLFLLPIFLVILGLALLGYYLA